MPQGIYQHHTRIYQNLLTKGQKFNRLTALKFVERRNYHAYWLFECDCGKERIAYVLHVIKGKIQSCGCLNDELKRQRKASLKHGLSTQLFYKIWQGIHQRTRNPNDKSWTRYGGRGIEVCKRWQKFENFRDDMYESYLQHIQEFGRLNTSLDRKKNDGPYASWNCRWATRKEQANNRG